VIAVPGQPSVTKLHDLIGGCGMCRRTGATHSDPGTASLGADCGLREVKLGSDLAQGPAAGVQVGRTLNIHCATVTVACKRPAREAVYLLSAELSASWDSGVMCWRSATTSG
jgi:hypothetical protein